jgi:hypothetical protein
MADTLYNVYITEKCYCALEKHIQFIANVSAEAAENFRNDFLQTAKGLEVFPEKNVAVRLMIAPDFIYHRALIGKYHALLYEIEGNDIFVDLVVDLRQTNQTRLI